MNQKIIESALKKGIKKKCGIYEFPMNNAIISILYVEKEKKYAITYVVMDGEKPKDSGYFWLDDYNTTWCLMENINE